MTRPTADSEPSPAELFERFFGPSIFTPWTDVLLDQARPRPGERVLDLACATGIVAREVARIVGPDGDVVGVDVDPEMLAVAKDRARSEGVTVEWRRSDAADLDMPDGAFDLVVCQQGLQFFDQPADAARETARVLDDGGRAVLSVWQPLERHPVYESLLTAEAKHLNAAVEDVATPFVFGSDARLRRLLDEAGFGQIEVTERTLDVTFPDAETFVALTVMAGAAVVPEMAMDDSDAREELIETVARECEGVLEAHRDRDMLRFPMPSFVATGAKLASARAG